MFNAYYNNNNGESHGVSWRFLRDSTSIKEGTWTFYLHESGYARDYYPTVSTFGFDVPGVTNAITYKFQARLAHSADSVRFHLGDAHTGTGSSLIATEFA